MKKLFFYSAAVLAMVFAASCQKETVSSAKEGDLVEVTFQVAMPETIGTKVIIGQNPVPDFNKKLTFAVYRNGEYLPNAIASVTKDFGTGTTATVSVTLVKGQNYDFLFWADYANSGYYTVNPGAKTATVNYDVIATNNNVNADAWYHVEKSFKVTDNTSLNNNGITLRRPLAQINVGTQDYDTAVAAGVTVTKSQTVIKGVAKTLDLFTGEGKDAVDITLAPAEIPYSDGTTLTAYYDPQTQTGTEYQYMSVSYVLPMATANPNSTVDYSIYFYENGNATQVNDIITVNSLPIRKNYRTNLINASVLTEEFAFNIVIDPMFDGELVDENFDATVDEEIPYK